MLKSTNSTRKGIVDLWNARLTIGARWTASDNPIVVSTSLKPFEVVGYRTACQIHKRYLSAGDADYHMPAFIHTCTDDIKFDGIREGIWTKPESFIEMARHFDGVACVDFSIYADMPEAVKRWQVYKMRTIEFALTRSGIPVIVNARWGTPQTWSYTIDELPERCALCVGTVGSGLARLENRPVFESGLRRILSEKHPTRLVVIGSASNPVFHEAREQGVEIRQFDGETCTAFKAKVSDAHV